MKTYTRSEVAAKTGLRASKIQFYTDRGFIKPEVMTTGRGTRRRYSEDNIAEILILSGLVESGIPIETASEGIKHALRDHPPGAVARMMDRHDLICAVRVDIKGRISGEIYLADNLDWDTDWRVKLKKPGI